MKKILCLIALLAIFGNTFAINTHAQSMFDDYNPSTDNFAYKNEAHRQDNLSTLNGKQVEIASGNNYACELLVSGKAKCWGFNKLGGATDKPSDNSSPAKESSNVWEQDREFETVESGADFNCALDNGDDIYCWGHNERGQLGTDTVDDKSTKPLKVEADVKFKKVYTKDHYACAIGEHSHAYCWGDGSNGEVGNGKKGYFKTPQKVATDVQFSRLSMSSTFVCGVETDTNALYCWGKGAGGSTKNLDSSVPVKI